TIGFPASFFTDPLNARSTGVYRALHEFTHSQGDYPGVSHTTILRCYAEPRPGNGDRTGQTPVTFFDTPEQAILSDPHCDRTQPSWIDIMGLVKSEDDALNLNGIIKLKFGWLLDSNVHSVTQSETLTIRAMDREAATEEIQMLIVPLAGSEKAIVLELRSA